MIRAGLVGRCGHFRIPDNIQRVPFQVVTVYNPAQQETDPRTGVEAGVGGL